MCNQLLLQFSMNHFEKITAFLDLDNFQVRLQYWIASLCNQLLPEFSSNQFETLHRCYKHVQDVHVSLCNQLLPEFSNNQFETFLKCYKHIEDVHVTFNRQENNFC